MCPPVLLIIRIINITLDSKRIDVLYRNYFNCNAKCKSIAGIILYLRVCKEQNRSLPDNDSPKRRKKRRRAFSRESFNLKNCELYRSRRDDQTDLDITDAKLDIFTFGTAAPLLIANAFIT
jgi:hypothetical protein